MKKIVILCNNASGLYDFRGMLIRALIEKGYNVKAVVPITKEDVELVAEGKLRTIGCELDYMPIERRGMNPLKDSMLLFRYLKYLNREKPELVITYTIKCNLYGGIVCRILQIPYAINITGLGTAFQNEGMLRKLVIAMYRVSCKKAKVVFFENESNKKFFIDEGIVAEANTYRLYGAGVDLERFAVTEYPDESEPMRFLFIGRVMKEKGIDEFFEAARYITKKYPGTEFHIVGNYEDDYQEETEQLVKEKVIYFHGYQEDVRPFIKKCSAFVLPSYHEGMANTLLEAGAMARPLITSDIPGCREAVIHGTTGFLCKKGSASSLIELIERFERLNYKERMNMGMQERKFIEQWFDKKVVVRDTVTMLGITKNKV